MRVHFVLVALLLPGVAATPLLVAVVPDLPGSASGGEGFAVASTGAANLEGWTVGDGETTWTFPAGSRLDAGRPMWVVGNLTDWTAHDGPDPVLEAGPPALRLGNEGDQLDLRSPDGTLVDSFAYGTGAEFDPPQSPGLVLERLREGQGWLDTDSAKDWRTPRLHRIGESVLDRPRFDVEHLTLYASPDSSFGVLTDLAASAARRLHLHVYELRSPSLVDALVASKDIKPGLDLQVLVDGNPVGMSSDERHATADALRRIQAAGGRVLLAGNGRYDDHHLKVLIADDAVAVQSENWVPSGVPEDPTWGNRGWGAVVHDAEASAWFAEWMQADRDAWDSQEFDLATFDPTFAPPPRIAPRSGAYPPTAALDLHGEFHVTPVIAPDHTQDPTAEPVSAIAAAARSRVWAQQLDVSLDGRNSLGWRGDDPLARALVAAAGAGATVRVEAAAPFAAGDRGNADALAWLADRGVEGRLFERPGFATLHNKGVVADDVAVVGSMNGNLHSRAQNREVDVILEGPGVADYYARLAASDWESADPPRDWSVPGKDLRGLPQAPWPMLLALLLVAGLLARRWS